MPDNKDKINDLHGNLIKDGYELPDINTFKKDMSNPASLTKLRETLVKDGYDMPDINTFKRDMGFGVDFKAPKYEEKIEKPKSTSIFGEMPGPTIAVSESTKGQNLKQQELIAQEVSQAPERRKKAVDTTLGMWANQNNVDINSPKAKKQRSIYEQGIDSKEFSVSYGEKGLQLVRNVGAIDAYLSALKETNDVIKEYDNVTKMSDEEASRYFTNKAQTQEIMPARGTGILGAPAEFLGSATRMLTKQSLGSLLATGTALALAPETMGGSLAAIGMLGGTIALAPDMMKQNYLSEFERRYQEGISQGMSNEEAISKAREQAERAEKIGAAEAVGFAVGGKAVGKIFSKPVSGVGVKNAMWNVVKSTAPEVASVVGVTSGSAIAKDLSARQLGFDVSNKEIFDDAFDSASEGLKFMGAMTLFHGVQNGLAKIPKFAKAQLKSYINASDPGVPETVLNNLVENKVIEPDAAENTKQALNANKEAEVVLEPLKIQDEYVLGALTGKQERKIKLQNEIKQLKENDVSIGIKEKEAEIAKIDEEMSNINETGDVDANEIDKELPAFKPAVEPVVEIPKEIASLKDDEPLVLSVKNIEDIPEEFRDRAVVVKGITNEGRKKIFGLPIGKKTFETGPENIRYTITGKEAKDYAIKTQIEKTPSIESTVEKVTEESLIPQEAKTVEQLRAEEQAELVSKIPNAEQYKVDGKVDRTKLTNEEDIKAFDKVYDKYDKLITPLLKKETQIKDVNRVIEEIPKTPEVEVTEAADITNYKPEQQQFIKETRDKIGGEEQARQLYEKEGIKEWGETYEEFILRKGCE